MRGTGGGAPLGQSAHSPCLAYERSFPPMSNAPHGLWWNGGILDGPSLPHPPLQPQAKQVLRLGASEFEPTRFSDAHDRTLYECEAFAVELRRLVKAVEDYVAASQGTWGAGVGGAQQCTKEIRQCMAGEQHKVAGGPPCGVLRTPPPTC